jgi:AraC-like DNA-binding protein
MGVSPLKYLTQIRISHAKRLLRLKQRSGMSIQEIAWLSGFQDSLYFSRVFKKATGVAPQDWE